MFLETLVARGGSGAEEQDATLPPNQLLDRVHERLVRNQDLDVGVERLEILLPEVVESRTRRRSGWTPTPTPTAMAALELHRRCALPLLKRVRNLVGDEPLTRWAVREVLALGETDVVSDGEGSCVMGLGEPLRGRAMMHADRGETDP